MVEKAKTKLDLKDKKILALLDENARYSNSQIARRVKLSKPAIEYRLNRFKKNGLIFNFFTLVNFTKLGYSQYKLYLKFQNTNFKNENQIINYCVKQNHIIWVAQIRGRWDLAISFFCRNNYEFGRILSAFMNRFSEFILEKDVLLTEYSPMYSKEYLIEKGVRHEFVYGIPEKLYELDEIDKKILKELAVNARISILDLSEKIKLTRDIINYRIKKLTKERIIIRYGIFLNLNKMGINHYKLILRTKNFDETAENKIKQYVAKHKKATQFLKLIGSWDLEIEFETEDENELYKILIEIRKEFSEIIRDFDIIRITENYKFNFFPFG